MNKIQIHGSRYSDTDLRNSVCTHLSQILNFIVERGNSYDRGAPLNLDMKGGGATLFVDKPIDFDSIENLFDIPNFIELNRNHKAVVCRRCWCDISEKR